MSRMRGRPREFERTEVLDRAMELFWAQGYEATPISELVDHLGIGRQSLYLAFGGKRELFEAALLRYCEIELRPLLEIITAAGSPLQNVKNLIRFWQRRSSEEDFRGCLLGHTAAELGMRDPQVAALLDRGFEQLEDALTETLRQAQEAGELDPRKQPRALARMLITAAQGAALWGPVRQSKPYMRDVIKGLYQLLE